MCSEILAASQKVETAKDCVVTGTGPAGGDEIAPAQKKDAADSTSALEWEQRVMWSLGIRDRDVMRELRTAHLCEGTDWVKQSNRILYTASGRIKIAQAVADASDQHQTAPHPQNAPSAPVAEALAIIKTAAPTRRLLVVSCPQHNPYIILCRLPDSDPAETYRFVVRVRDNRHFVPGTATGEIWARHLHGNVWEYAGNPQSEPTEYPRCPRFRGRW